MKSFPDDRGYFGEYGGTFVPETLMEPLAELERAYRAASHDKEFTKRLDGLLADYVGRPTPLGCARRIFYETGSKPGRQA